MGGSRAHGKGRLYPKVRHRPLIACGEGEDEALVRAGRRDSRGVQQRIEPAVKLQLLPD